MSRPTIKAGTALCEDCGKLAELRPYGPNNTWVCFKCAMKDEEGTKERFGKMLDGGVTLDLTDQKGKP